MSLTLKKRIKVFDVPKRRAAWCEDSAYACHDETRNNYRPDSSTRRKSCTACSITLGTFRYLALQAQTVRNALPSDSVACLNL